MVLLLTLLKLIIGVVSTFAHRLGTGQVKWAQHGRSVRPIADSGPQCQVVTLKFGLMRSGASSDSMRKNSPYLHQKGNWRDSVFHVLLIVM
jgi:hypothetical protein